MNFDGYLRKIKTCYYQNKQKLNQKSNEDSNRKHSYALKLRDLRSKSLRKVRIRYPRLHWYRPVQARRGQR